MARWGAAGAAIATAAGLAIAGGSTAQQAPPAGEMTLTSAHRATPAHVAFTVIGEPVKGIYPGVTKDIRLTLSNPYGFDLRIQALRGEVVSSSKRACRPGRATLLARKYTGPLPVTVPAQSRRSVGSIPVFMPADASINCRKTTFTILLVGTATKAGR